MLANPIIKTFLIILSGVVLSLSAPGYDGWFIAWFGLVPLFIVINTSKKIKSALVYSFLFGFSYNLSYLLWLFSLHPLDWLGFSRIQSIFISMFSLLAVAGYNSVFFVLFASLVIGLKKIQTPYNKGFTGLLLTCIIWLIVFNKISGLEILLGFPWTLIEYSQYKNLYLIQIAEYFGSISISFILVFFNLVLANLFIWIFNIEKISNRYISKNPGQVSSLVKGFCFIFILIICTMIYGIYLYEKNINKFSNDSQNICILQGNLPLKFTRGKDLNITFARKVYGDLIKNNAAKLFISPEGSLPGIINSDLHTQYWLKVQSMTKQADIISGAYCKDDEVTNCAVSYSLNDGKFSYYEKERLVPFGEFMPFVFLLPEFMKKLSRNIIGDGFAGGELTIPVKTSIGKAGINICFELIFPAIIRRHSLQGANFLVNLSDLSWFSSELVKKQFLSFAVFRAIENRKWIIIASNSGISAFIEPNGRIKSQSISNTSGVLLDWINGNKKITFYTKYGW